jgi:hypothetical protein
MSFTHAAQWTLAAFVATFLLARILVLLIMTRRMPDLYFYAGQTHVHHLNYGIFLLVLVGGWAIFGRPTSVATVRWLAVLYGIGLALTFDEFGMWLHLGGGYWQRASYDAVVTIAAILGLLIVAPSVRRWRYVNWLTAAAVLTLLVIGLRLLNDVVDLWTPGLQRIESGAPQ